jgi:hypothetical protein
LADRYRPGLDSGSNVLSALTRFTAGEELVMMTSRQIARRSYPCEEMSPHGYLGIEVTVLQPSPGGPERPAHAELRRKVWNRQRWISHDWAGAAGLSESVI